MFKGVKLEHCRNFADRQLELFNRTYIVGPNGAGKSTILEALRVLSVGKSFRTSRLEEMISFNESFLRLEATISPHDKLEFFYGNQFEVEPSRDRRLSFQGNTISWVDFLGRVPTVLFTPADMEIVLGSPDVRRRYLDSVLWQVDPGYRHAQVEFARALREKAALLFVVKLNRASPEELEPWNELISGMTATIRAARQRYVDYLNDYFSKIVAGTELAVEYQFDPRPVAELQSQEVKSAQNLFGAHRDELILKFDDFSARRYASRGQSRLVVSYLKAAEADFLHQKTSQSVTILLDDALAELDHGRIEETLQLFDADHQLILTSATQLTLPKGWETIQL